MASNKNQHYVPQCYLRQFSVDGSKVAINLFNIDRQKIFNKAPIKSQCSKSYFYGEDLALEKALQPIEGKYSSVVKEISGENYHLNDEHRLFLKLFWQLQYMRTEAASRRSIEMTNGMGEAAGLDPTHFKLEMKEAVQMSMRNFIQENHIMNDMKVCLLRNKSSIDFVTSDDPAVLTNRWFIFDKRAKGASFGLGSAGALMLLPISPKILCIGYDPDVYSIPHKNGWVDIKNKNCVLSLNEHQFLNCRANIYFSDPSSETDLQHLYEVTKNERPEPRHRINYAVLDETVDGYKRYKVVDSREAEQHTEALIHTQTINPSPSSWPQQVKWRSKGYVYTNGTGIGYIRLSRIPISKNDFKKERAR